MLIAAFNPLTMDLKGPYQFTVSGPAFTQVVGDRPERIALYLMSDDVTVTLFTPFPNVTSAPLTPPTGTGGLYVITYTTHPYLCGMEWFASTTGPIATVTAYEVVSR